jgi:hypothetical protein
MIAYWLARYQNADFVTAAQKKKKYEQMVAKLETKDAKAVAEAWFSNTPVPYSNRFKPVAERIQTWASSASGSRT